MSSSEKLSVVIPAYNSSKEDLEILNESLNQQSLVNFEVIVVDDCSQFNNYSVFGNADYEFKIVEKSSNSGPADTRNCGVKHSSGKYLFFTDTDCKLLPDTLDRVQKYLRDSDIVVGNTITETSTLTGELIAYLGFPGGGNIGFHSVWKVDKYNFTTSFSSCNLGMRREVFEALGGFDISSPVPGGEDTILAEKAIGEGWRIKYNRLQVVYHKEKKSLKSFCLWQITRGRGNYYIKKKVPGVSGYLKLRVWSFINSLRKSRFYAPFVIILIGISVLLQSYGYYLEKFTIRKSGRSINA